jgi:hypothetical protein
MIHGVRPWVAPLLRDFLVGKILEHVFLRVCGRVFFACSSRQQISRQKQTFQGEVIVTDSLAEVRNLA